jgi:hypothetical protein
MLRHTTAIALSLFVCNVAAAQQPFSTSPYLYTQPGAYPTWPNSTPGHWNGSNQGYCPGGVCPTRPSICGPDGCYQSPVQTLPYNYPRPATPRVRYPYTNPNPTLPYNWFNSPAPQPYYPTTPNYGPAYTPGSSYPGYPSIPTYNPHLLSDADQGGGVLH